MELHIAKSAVEEIRNLHVDGEALSKMLDDIKTAPPADDEANDFTIVTTGPDESLVAFIRDRPTSGSSEDGERILLGVKSLDELTRVARNSTPLAPDEKLTAPATR